MFGSCFIMQYILIRFAIIFLKMKELVAICKVAVSGLCLFSWRCGLVGNV